VKSRGNRGQAQIIGAWLRCPRRNATAEKTGRGGQKQGSGRRGVTGER